MHKPHKSHVLRTVTDPTVISINPSGEYLAVGCTNGNMHIYKLRSVGEGLLHTLTADPGWGGVAISSASWISTDVLLCGRMGGLALVVKMDDVRFQLLLHTTNSDTFRLVQEERIHAMNFEAAGNSRSIQWISYNSDLGLVATATSSDISIWHWKRTKCMPSCLMRVG